MTFDNTAENRKKLADAFRASAKAGKVLVESIMGLGIYEICDRIEQGVGIGKTVFEDAAAYIESRDGEGTVEGFLRYLHGEEQPQLTLAN